MKVLIVPDKFKGTLRANEAADAIAAGWRQARANDELELLPMSDGGDGFGEIIGRLLAADRCTTQTVNAAHENIQADWWWSEKTQTGVVESARVIGLAMLPPGRFHPFELDTLGLGHLLREIAREHRGCRLIVGIGGSATNDGGFGMARGLGFRFMDGTDNCLDRWLELDRALHVRAATDEPPFAEVVIATDVENPLLGESGATRVYGPQKGMRVEDFPIAEKCLERLAQVVARDLNLDAAAEPGTGAAGGLGYGLRVFLRGRFEPGFQIFADLSGLREKIEDADLVITAEGCIDAQTGMGKGTGAVLNLARAAGKPCFGLAALLGEESGATAFDKLLGIVPALASAEEARKNPARWLSELARRSAISVQ
jgi:glycerate kinase